MKMSKKIAFIFTAVILLAVLVGNLIAFMSCQSEEEPPVVSETTTADTITEAETTATAVENTYVRPEMYNHEVMGEGIGVNPGRVVWAHNPDSYDWDGKGFFWNSNNFNYDIVQKMMNDSVTSLAGGKDTYESWDMIFKSHNQTRGIDAGYVRGQKIAIKVNMNGIGDFKGQTNSSFTAPIPVQSLLVSLVTYAGVDPSDITVFDASRVIPDYMQEICGTGILKGVSFKYNDQGGANDCTPDMSFPIVWSENFEGDTCYLPTCLTEADYLIVFSNIKGHDLAGVTLSAKNHFGTIMNTSRNNPPQAANIHGYATAHDYSFGEGWTWEQRPMNTYTVLTDFFANKHIGEKTVLYLLDAFAVAHTQSVQLTSDMKWTQAPFNGDWTSSLFISQDPVALDSVGTDFIANEPTMPYYEKIANGEMTHENYLHEAAQANNAPSGTVYKNGDGVTVGSLGTHEHWNNPDEKLYSRNLGHDYGIELVKIN
jgi:hypothetical protein